MTPETPLEVKALIETKASITDVGGAFDELMTTFEGFRETNDQADLQMEKRGHVDPVTADKLAKLNREVSETKRRMDELTLKGLRPHKGGHDMHRTPRSAAGLQHKAAFESYVRQGEAHNLRQLEAKALSVGSDLVAPRLGAIAVLTRGADPSLGHVGFVVGETADSLVLLGGNQNDAVTVTAYPKSRLVSLRWPRVEAGREPAPAQPDDVFDRALAHVLAMEGGFSDDPHDPGGPTNKGITLAVYAAWKNGSLDATSTPALLRELKAIPDATVRAIYSERYWRRSSADRLSAPLAVMHFDTAVNHGPGTAIRILQHVVGVDVDGEIGPVTLAAVAAAPMMPTLERYAANRRERYRAMPHFWRFGRGWLARVDRTLALSAKIAAENPSARNNSTGSETMTDIVEQKGKWWGNSLTIWGAITTGLTAIVPVLGPLIGIDVSGDAARDLGTQSVAAAQGLLALIGTVMTIFGRARATQPIERRVLNVRL